MIVLGVRLWILIYIVFSILSFIFIIAYWKREQLKKYWYGLRHPEKLIKVVLHYDTGIYREYYRLIPDTETFKLDNKTYRYDDEEVIKYNDFFSSRNESNDIIINIDGTKYNVNKLYGIKRRRDSLIEIHYKANNPNPITYKSEGSQIGISSKNLDIFQENDLFNKLLTVKDNAGVIIFILLICAFNLIATIFIIAKMMGWLK
jgi:hypothetical protein